jgi:hypothetical protein
MQQQAIELELVGQLVALLEKGGFERIVPVDSTDLTSETTDLDTILISIRSLNARYDKNEAIAQIRSLMDKYNIQVDELIVRNGLP